MAKEQRYTKGRAAAATVLGAYHAPFAAKKGKKLRATGRMAAEGFVGATGGQLAGAIATRGNMRAAQAGSAIGGLGGSYHGFRTNNKKGYYKKQPASKFGKSSTVSAFGIEHG
jgi:hypothetical protein